MNERDKQELIDKIKIFFRDTLNRELTEAEASEAVSEVLALSSIIVDEYLRRKHNNEHIPVV